MEVSISTFCTFLIVYFNVLNEDAVDFDVLNNRRMYVLY